MHLFRNTNFYILIFESLLLGWLNYMYSTTPVIMGILTVFIMILIISIELYGFNTKLNNWFKFRWYIEEIFDKDERISIDEFAHTFSKILQKLYPYGYEPDRMLKRLKSQSSISKYLIVYENGSFRPAENSDRITVKFEDISEDEKLLITPEAFKRWVSDRRIKLP